MVELKRLIGLSSSASMRDLLQGINDKQTRTSLLELLNIPNISENLRESVTELWQGHVQELEDASKGPLGFLLFRAAADDYSRNKQADNLAVANKYLRQPAVRAFIEDFYGLSSEYCGKTMTLHRVGTTSYILLLEKELVLKLIKARFLTNPNITEATLRYKEKYFQAISDYSPVIMESTRKYIVMTFLKGPTLREYADQTLFALQNKVESNGYRLTVINQVVGGICEALHHFEVQGISHNDISPDNIIIQQKITGEMGVKLIDFGVNYLLQERVGSTSALIEQQKYASPEVLEQDRGLGQGADLYSLGQIILELLSGQKYRRMEVANHLDRLWERYPEYAKIVESAIDEDPQRRLAAFESGTSPFLDLRRIFDTQTHVITEVLNERASAFSKAWQVFTVFLFGVPTPIQAQYRSIRALESRDVPTSDSTRLLWWAFTAGVLHVVVVVAFIAFLLWEAGLNYGETFGWFGGVASRVFVFHPKGLGRNLPGMIVGLSFSFVATKYYLSIFRPISVRHVSRITDFVVRMNAWFFAVPILWAIVIEPRDWPICSAIGVFVVGLNNLLTYRLALRAYGASVKDSAVPRSEAAAQFVRNYRGWWLLIGLYFIGLVMIGLLLEEKGRILNSVNWSWKLGDEWMYAIIVAIYINFFKMYLSNCMHLAPTIRGGLSRLYYQYGRIRPKSA